ncbi:Protein of unknown function [Cotesia congregata]|uniref:Uncharacterized protein n=1 Tax=Cotesia congregata TaxID=51543 RepID=A0A8J2MH74_COTCN|nr:Protein of unknown function [Cotesia congregata]
MGIRKIIWWLILVYSYDKISAFNDILYKRSPTLHAQMGQLFKSCYSDRLNPVVITTNLIDVIDELQVENVSFPLMTIDRDFKAKDIRIFIPAYPLYIVSTDSTDQLQGLLNELKSTPIWNIVSIFFFIEAGGNYCKNASQVLQLLWKFELLSSIYFCIEPNNDIMLYTYNPYTNRAPDSWTKVNTDDKPDSRWTLYKQLYIPNDKAVCQSFSYDKTKAPDGYEIKAIGEAPPTRSVEYNETYNISTFGSTPKNTDEKFMVSVFSALNITPRINYDDPGFYVEETAIGFIRSLINATHDISFTMRIVRSSIDVVDSINLHYQNGFLTLTQYRPFEIPAEEVIDFSDVGPAVVLFIGVLIVAFTTIVLNTGNDYIQAALDILQMVIEAEILTPLQRLSMKICFIGSFLMIFFMSPTIQGQISSFLSAPDQRNVDNLNDVYVWKYEFYFHPTIEDQILELNLWKNSSDQFLRPNDYTYDGCAQFVLNNSHAACIEYSEFQIADALKHNLHITKNYDLKFFMTFWVRKNWALKDRIDQISLRMTEAGLLDHWDKKTLHWPLKNIKEYESTNSSTELEQFELENMLFAYLLLLLTTAFAFIVLAFEILLKKIRPRRRLQLQQEIKVIMGIRKIIWWLILAYLYDKISAFDNNWYKRSPITHTQMGQLFKSCYSDRLNPVVITTNLIDIIDELPVEDVNFLMMTIDRDFKAKDIRIFIPAYPLYIVSTDSTDQLQGLLNELKSTPIWNIVSVFFFIEAEGNYCQNASQVLQLLWKFELLSSFYFCIEPNNDIMLYTYNPYTNRAPDSWSEVNTNDKPDSRWTLYNQLYIPNDKEICQSLSYDKTKVLDGYELKAASDPLSWENITRNATYDVSSFDKTLFNIEKMLMTSLLSALNVTPRIYYDEPGFYQNNTVIGYLKSLVNSTYDMGLGSQLVEYDASQVIDFINLHYQNGYLILTQYKPFEIPVEEVTDFYDILPAVTLFIGVLIVTFITIALNPDNGYVQAALDILRMVLGTGILTPFQRFSMKISFIVSFLIIFFMNPAIGGKISSYLSTPDQRNVESLKDVYDQKYNFYYEPVVDFGIRELNLWSNSSNNELLHPIDSAYMGCSEYVLNDSLAACMAYSEYQVADALKYKLHVTTTFDLKYYVSFWARKNWALKNRIDQIALRLTEAGLLDHWDKKSLHWPIKKIKEYQSISSSIELEQFELENMLFAYLLLLLTTAFAFIVLAFEILLKKIRPRRRLQLQQEIKVIMGIRKIIWWLILAYLYDKISAFDNNWYKRSPITHTQMGQLFKSCYSDRLNPVVITTNLIDIIDEFPVEDVNFLMMTIDRDFKAKDIRIFIPAYPLYIVSTDSTDQLQGLLNELKSTPIWNIVSVFFFIEAEGNYCQNASQVLQLLWKFELLSSFYFCIEPNNDIMLYTYNPYTNRAPDSWTKVNTNDKPDSRWTLYKQLYIPYDTKVCRSLNCNKTKVLNGYDMKATVDPISWKNITRNATYGVSSFDTTLVNIEKMFMMELFSALNVTPKINYDSRGFYENNTVRGYLKSLVNGTHDIGLGMHLKRRNANQIIDVINLHYQNNYFLLTQYRPFEVTVDEVTDFYDIYPAAVLLIGVLMVTFITIGLNTDHDYAQATRDILQMILGADILTSLQRGSMKICFVVSFLIIFFMNPAIEGKISSYLMSSEQRNVESIKDLYDQKYNFYYLRAFEDDILDPNLWPDFSKSKLLHPSESVYKGCSKYVLNDSSNACLTFNELQIADALKYKLHLTKILDLELYMTFWVRNNWALKNRIDQIALRMTEAGLLDHWDKKKMHWPLKEIKAYESINSLTEDDQFELENMLFSYILLLLTTTLALIVFGFEMLLKKIRSRRRLQLQQKIVIFNRRVHVINECYQSSEMHPSKSVGVVLLNRSDVRAEFFTESGYYVNKIRCRSREKLLHL